MKILDKETIYKIKLIDFYENQLKVIKKKRPKLSKGDLFLLNLFGDVYFYGVVLNTDINDPVYGENLIAVCITKHFIKSLDSDKFPQDIGSDDILVKPSIVSKAYWTKGYFYNTGYNVSEHLHLDYGFYDGCRACYVTEYGEKLGKEPQIASNFVLQTMIGIASDLCYELAKNNVFLKNEDRESYIKYVLEALDSRIEEKEVSKFDQEIYPFSFLKEDSRRYAIILDNFKDIKCVFNIDAEGNGYDWETVVKCFLKENFPYEREKIKFDSEASMFYMYCSDEILMKKIITMIVEELQENGLKRYISQIDFDNI